jgi:hypothetical protein
MAEELDRTKFVRTTRFEAFSASGYKTERGNKFRFPPVFRVLLCSGRARNCRNSRKSSETATQPLVLLIETLVDLHFRLELCQEHRPEPERPSKSERETHASESSPTRNHRANITRRLHKLYQVKRE